MKAPACCFMCIWEGNRVVEHEPGCPHGGPLGCPLDLDLLRENPRELGLALGEAVFSFNNDRDDVKRSDRLMILCGMATAVLVGLGPRPVLKCGQVDCPKDAEFRFTWPGREEAGACKAHSSQILRVAQALQLPLELIPVATAKGGAT